MRTSMRSGIVTWAWLGLAAACATTAPPATDETSSGATDGVTGTGVTADGTTATSAPGTTGPAGTTTTDGSSTTAAGSTGSTGPDATTDGSDGSTTTEGSGSSDSTTGPLPGLGEISGDCGLIDAMELDSPSPFAFQNAIDFGAIGFDYNMLTPGGQEVFDDGNLGGSSLESEVVSFEVLARCEGASLLATEAEILYTDPMGIKTDILVEMDGRVVGVSVTRAVGFPFDAPYTEMQAADLLTGKLTDILASTANVAPRNAWVKQILHVIAYADMHAQSILAAYATLPPEVTADTVLLVTVTHGDDAFVY